MVASKDSDGDGLPDALEERGCTEPFDADRDDDGILDGHEDIPVFNDIDHAGSFINATALFKTTASGAGTRMIHDPTARTSTAPASYALTPTEEDTSGIVSGPLTLNLQIQHDGSTAHDVNIGPIRITSVS